MMAFTAGIFRVDIGSPSPMWVTLSAGPHISDGPEFRFHPQQLRDLKHVIERAIAHVERHDPGETA